MIMVTTEWTNTGSCKSWIMLKEDHAACEVELEEYRTMSYCLLN